MVRRQWSYLMWSSVFMYPTCPRVSDTPDLYRRKQWWPDKMFLAGEIILLQGKRQKKKRKEQKRKRRKKENKKEKNTKKRGKKKKEVIFVGWEVFNKERKSKSLLM